MSQTQIIAKNEIDKFVATIISADKNLNKTNKKFVDFCEKYENNLVKNLAGNPKNPDAKNGFANFVKEDLNEMREAYAEYFPEGEKVEVPQE